MIAYLNFYGTDTPWVSTNGGNEIASGVGPRAGVHFADIDGDGKADYLYVNSAGAVSMYQNGGQIATGWDWIGPTTIATGDGTLTDQSTVFFADINGDGRADYVISNSNGGLDVFLNIGDAGSTDITWTPFPNIAGGLGTPNITLADLDGDGTAWPKVP